MNVLEIGKMLVERRKVLRITQQELADLAGVSVHTISNLESGKGNPTLASLCAVTDVLGLELVLPIRRHSGWRTFL